MPHDDIVDMVIRRYNRLSSAQRRGIEVACDVLETGLADVIAREPRAAAVVAALRTLCATRRRRRST